MCPVVGGDHGSLLAAHCWMDSPALYRYLVLYTSVCTQISSVDIQLSSGQVLATQCHNRTQIFLLSFTTSSQYSSEDQSGCRGWRQDRAANVTFWPRQKQFCIVLCLRVVGSTKLKLKCCAGWGEREGGVFVFSYLVTDFPVISLSAAG